MEKRAFKLLDFFECVRGLKNTRPIIYAGGKEVGFYNRVFQESESKIQLHISDDFEKTESGMDENGRLVIYCPKLFRPLLSDRYTQLKDYPYDWLVENGLVEQGSKSLQGVCACRIELACSLIVWGGSLELEKIWMQLVDFVFILDDFLETERIQSYKEIRAKIIDMLVRIFGNRSVGLEEINQVQWEFESIPTDLSSRTSEIFYSDSTYFGEKSRLKTILRSGEIVVGNCKRAFSQSQLDLLFTVVRNYVRKSHIQMDNVYNLEHRGQIPTSQLYFNTRKDSVAMMIGFVLSSFADPEEEFLKAYNDGLTNWMSYLTAVINDVYSYKRETRTQMHFFNLVNIIRIQQPELSELGAIGIVVKLYNEQVRAVEALIGTMDEENRRYYTRTMKTMTGTIEWNNLVGRYGWENISGISEAHDKLVYAGKEY